MSVAMRTVIGALFVGLALAIPQAWAEFRGTVQVVVNPEAPRSEWRRVPLPGAFVVVDWSVTVPAPAHAITTCRYSEIARSDERGEYVMEGPNFVTATLARTSFYVYSRGLEQINYPGGGSLGSAAEITMARSTLPSHERLSRIASYVEPPCFDVKLSDPSRVLGAYRGSLLEEARGLNVESPRGLSDLKHMEVVVERASERREPLRAVVKSPSGSIESASPPPSQER